MFWKEITTWNKNKSGNITVQDLLGFGLSCSATTNFDLFLRPSRKVTTRSRMSSALLEVKVYSSPLMVAKVKLWLCNFPPLKEQVLQIKQQIHWQWHKEAFSDVTSSSAGRHHLWVQNSFLNWHSNNKVWLGVGTKTTWSWSRKYGGLSAECDEMTNAVLLRTASKEREKGRMC